jgi:hypothetical protein
MKLSEIDAPHVHDLLQIDAHSLAPDSVSQPPWVRENLSMVNDHNTREDMPALEVIGEFTTCAAKSYWIALVLMSDEEKAARIVSSGIHDTADSGTVFGTWLCAWGIRVVIEACVALRTDELRKEGGSGEYWRAKATEGSTLELQQAPFSTERLRRALLLLPLFPRFVFVLRVLEGYSLSYVASILNVDKEACQAALNYSFGALAQALTPVQLAKQQ